MYDFANVTGSLQGLFAAAVSAAFGLALKLLLFSVFAQLAALLLPRYLRPLVGLAALALVFGFPDQLSRAGDVLLAALGFTSQAGALAAPDALTALEAQVRPALDGYVAWVSAQLGL